MSETLSRLISLTAGTLYPAYKSYKAVRTKDVREYVKWMMYWIVFAVYCFVENIADVLVAFWFPFYFQLKIVFMFWLLSPWTKGASILYRKWIHPNLMHYERDIDAFLEQAKSESYNQIVRIGSRTLLCAKDIVTEAAVRGQQQLVNQLQRSQSMNDVNTKKSIRPSIEEIQEEDHHDPEYDPDQDVSSSEDSTRRRRRSSSRSRALEGSEHSYSATMPRRNPSRRL
ncbi:unnamed protein product [Auanema sp. JU1783]|nr:unnamed protein product [Auanema sp. JU1783]